MHKNAITARDTMDGAKAIELRIAGMTYAKIGEQLGVNTTRVFRVVNKILATVQEKTREQAAELIELELQRLDTMQAGVWQAAINGDNPSIDRVLRIMERRAKLLGLDASIDDPTGQAPVINIVLAQTEPIEQMACVDIDETGKVLQ